MKTTPRAARKVATFAHIAQSDKLAKRVARDDLIIKILAGIIIVGISTYSFLVFAGV